MLEDWLTIAAEFPFLNLFAQLYSGESGEDNIEPVVEYLVSEGRVTIQTPDKSISIRHLRPTSTLTADLMQIFGNPHRERGVALPMLKEAVDLVRRKRAAA